MPTRRALTALRTRGVIEFRGRRRVTICDRRALEIATEGGDEALLSKAGIVAQRLA